MLIGKKNARTHAYTNALFTSPPLLQTLLICLSTHNFHRITLLFSGQLHCFCRYSKVKQKEKICCQIATTHTLAVFLSKFATLLFSLLPSQSNNNPTPNAISWPHFASLLPHRAARAHRFSLNFSVSREKQQNQKSIMREGEVRLARSEREHYSETSLSAVVVWRDREW